MSAAVSFSNTHSYGIQKPNQYYYYILKRDSTNRGCGYGRLSLPWSLQRPLMRSRHLFLNPNNTKTGQYLNSTVHNEALLQSMQENAEEEISRATLIWRAIKLPIYCVAFIPPTVGSAAAYYHTGVLYVKPYFLVLFSACLVVAWVNLRNDVYDYDTGADKNKKESVVNLTKSHSGTHIAAYLLLTLSAMCLITVAWDAKSLHAVLLSSYGVICGYIYQSPPFRLGYLGLGEPLCFAAFGPFATTAFYLLQGNNTRALPITGALASSILVGLSSSLILLCSHFHQVEDDRAVGKFSPLVKFGTEAGSKIVKTIVTILYFLVFILGLIRALPFLCVVFCALTLPIGKSVVSFVEENHKDKSKIFMAKYYCVRLHTAFGAAMVGGLVGL